jgi:ABC-2 type transport system ATP-binding protein
MVSRNESSEHVIVAENVRKNYGRIEALRGVNLTVRQGEIFGLLGANGAGKTTLIKTLIGSTRPAAGSISVLGLDPVRQARAVRRQIGYMPQAVVLYEDLSARDNLRFFGRAHGLADLEQLIDDVLNFTELRTRENDPVYSLSGGMKQRASLACAILHRPRLLLLDEPTAGIDPKLREAFWSHFRQLAGDGATILVSTHQMDEAVSCDRLAIMRDGVVLACDTPRNLLRYGQATVRIWQDDHVEVQTVPDYRDQLPHLLRRYHLDETVSRIEIEEDTLQTVVLNLINARETQNA